MHMLVSDDIKNVDLTKIHNLSGPIAIEGAEPGDCLVVDILDGMRFGHSHKIDHDDHILSETVRQDAMGLHGMCTLAAEAAKVLTYHHSGHLRT